jgi:hypothetical protein
MHNQAAVLLWALLLIIGNAGVSDVLLSTPQLSGRTGEVLTLPVHLENTTQPVATLVLNLYFDVAKVELNDITFAAELAELGKQTYSRILDSRAIIILTLGAPLENPGELFYLHFRLRNYIEYDAFAWLLFYEASAATSDALRMDVTYSPGIILLLDQKATYHSADINRDRIISLSELLHVIQLFNAGAYHCDTLSKKFYAPGMGEIENETCIHHDSDYLEPAWNIGLRELLHLVQLYNASGYQYDSEIREQFYPITQKSK